MTTPNLIFGNDSWCFPNRSLMAQTLSTDDSFNRSYLLPDCDSSSCYCAIESTSVQNFAVVIQHFAIGITFFNMIAHLVSAVVFMELIRGRDLAQQNHHLLFILSIFEMTNAFFVGLKPILTNTSANFKGSHSFESLSALKLSYYLTMLLHCLTSTSLFCRNWWLVVIALTRSVTVVRLQRILKNADGAQPVGTILKRVNHTVIGVCLGGIAVALLVHGFIVPIRLTFYLCRSRPLFEWPDRPNGVSIKRVKVINFEPKTLFRVLVDSLHELLVLVLPIIIMALATIVIWVSLRRLARGPCMVPNQRVQMMSRVTRLIAVLLTVFVVLEPLAPVCFLIRQLLSRSEKCWRIAIDYIILPIAELLIALDSTTNLVVYYLWDKSFRHHLRRRFLNKCPQCSRQDSHATRQARRDTFPTTNHAPTGPTGITMANVTNIGSTAQRNGSQGNIELRATEEPLLNKDSIDNERGTEAEENL